jgi:hypothetical protein
MRKKHSVQEQFDTPTHAEHAAGAAATTGEAAAVDDDEDEDLVRDDLHDGEDPDDPRSQRRIERMLKRAVGVVFSKPGFADHPDASGLHGEIKPCTTHMTWNTHGVNFASLAAFVESTLKMRVLGGHFSDWACSSHVPGSPLPGDACPPFNSPFYENTWQVPFLRGVVYPVSARVQSYPGETVVVVVHSLTNTAWIALPDAARVMGRPWATVATTVMASLVCTELAIGRKGMFRVGGTAAQGILACIRDNTDNADEKKAVWGLPCVHDGGTETVFNLAGLVCMSRAMDNTVGTLTTKMFQRRGHQ